MSLRSAVAVTLTPLFAVTLCSCGTSSSSNTHGASAVTFTKVYSEILSGSCTPCHAAGGVGAVAGGLDMSTQAAAYANLQAPATGACAMSGLNRVVPGNAAMSLLVEKVANASPPCGTEMPFGCGGTGTCLSAAQVQEIEAWINDGANND